MARGTRGRYRAGRRLTYELFAPTRGGELGYYVDWGIMILIAANVAAVVLGTVGSVQAQYETALRWFEVGSVVVFTVEYLARVWAAVDDPDVAGPVVGRIRFATRPLLVVDLLAILPFYLTIVGVGLDLRFLRMLRLVRVLRLLKLARYSESMQAFAVVLRRKKPDLVIAFFANSILLVVASSAMYYIEQDAQPRAFSSIPEAMWWGVATLTTVGYGDVHPITPLGQFIGAIVAILGIGLFALPASILASGFIEVAGTNDGPERCPHCGEPIDQE